MKNHNLLFLLLPIIAITSIFCNPKSKNEIDLWPTDFFTVAQFDEEISRLVILQKKDIDVNYAIQIIRCYNSIHKYNLRNNLYDSFCQWVMDDDIRFKLIDVLEMRPCIGRGFYSRKYNLTLGGGMVVRDYFGIDELTEFSWDKQN